MKLKFNVTGMTCAACSARVEKVTNAVQGVEKAEVNLLAGTMQVEAENGNVVPAIIKAVHANRNSCRQQDIGSIKDNATHESTP